MHISAHWYLPQATSLFILLTALSGQPALAQSSHAQRQAQQESARQEQRLRQQRQEKDRKALQNAPNARLPDAHVNAELGEHELPLENPCFRVSALELAIPASLSENHKKALTSILLPDPLSFAQRELDNYVGQCIGQQGINLIIKRLTNTALSKGYSTTRFGVSQQDLSKGTLTITVIPGIIRTIRFKDEPVRGSWKTAFPARPGDLLNLRDLEQGLEQLKRVSNQDADMQIVPGNLPGESDIIISLVQTSPWFGSVTLDNSGSQGTGKYQLGGNVGYNNLAGINDVLTMGVTTNADVTKKDHDTKNASLAYWVPYGYWLFGLSANYSKYEQVITTADNTITSYGRSSNAELTVQNLFHRSQSQKNSIQFKAGKRWGHANSASIELTNQQRNTHYIELGLIHVQYFGRAQLDLTAAQRWSYGRNLLSTVDMGAYGNFTMQTVDASLFVPFRLLSRPLSYSSTLHGQSSPKALYSSEHLSLGTRYAVRGFDEGTTLNSEKGFYWRNELSIPLADTGQSAYTGIDVGKVYGPYAKQLNGNTLAGAAVGLRGFLQGASYDVGIGLPVHKAREFNSTSPVLTFSLAYTFK